MPETASVADLSLLNVPELKNILKRVHMVRSGRKADLIQRLEMYASTSAQHKTFLEGVLRKVFRDTYDAWDRQANMYNQLRSTVNAAMNASTTDTGRGTTLQQLCDPAFAWCHAFSLSHTRIVGLPWLSQIASEVVAVVVEEEESQLLLVDRGCTPQRAVQRHQRLHRQPGRHTGVWEKCLPHQCAAPVGASTTTT